MVHETPVIVFLKQLFLICKVVQIKMVYFVSLVLRTCILRTRKAKCSILQSVNIFRLKNILPILNTSLSSHSVHSLYFFHFVKEQYSLAKEAKTNTSNLMCLFWALPICVPKKDGGG